LVCFDVKWLIRDVDICLHRSNIADLFLNFGEVVMADWDVNKAIAHLNAYSGEHSKGSCAHYVREAIEAGGGIKLKTHNSAKDYGSSLEAAGFHHLQNINPQAGDVAIIQPIPGHPHGHMTMFNGKIWVSDFKQYHGYYPGSSYRKLRPSVTFYRK